MGRWTNDYILVASRICIVTLVRHVLAEICTVLVLLVIHESLKPSSQYAVAAKPANKSLGVSNRMFMFKDNNTTLKLYKSLVRPKLEYCVQSWCPCLRKDRRIREGAKRATPCCWTTHSSRRRHWSRHWSVASPASMRRPAARGIHWTFDVNIAWCDSYFRQ